MANTRPYLPTLNAIRSAKVGQVDGYHVAEAFDQISRSIEDLHSSVQKAAVAAKSTTVTKVASPSSAAGAAATTTDAQLLALQAKVTNLQNEINALVFPQSVAAQPHKYINSYDASTGLSTTATDIFVFNQAVPLSVWVIIHNLGYSPAVVVEDSTNRQVYGDVHYDSPNQLTVTFTAAFSGKATLS